MKHRKIYSNASIDPEDPDYIAPGEYFSRSDKGALKRLRDEGKTLTDPDWYFDTIDRAGGYDKYIAREKKNRSIYSSSSSLVDEFMRYHDDEHNHSHGFSDMYHILEQYGDDSEPVDVVFRRAPRDQQIRMINLIKPVPKYNTREGARRMYYDALDMNIENAGKDYCEGVVDAIEALFDGGWLNESDFRTDL